MRYLYSLKLIFFCINGFFSSIMGCVYEFYLGKLQAVTEYMHAVICVELYAWNIMGLLFAWDITDFYVCFIFNTCVKLYFEIKVPKQTNLCVEYNGLLCVELQKKKIFILERTVYTSMTFVMNRLECFHKGSLKGL